MDLIITQYQNILDEVIPSQLNPWIVQLFASVTKLWKSHLHLRLSMLAVQLCKIHRWKLNMSNYWHYDCVGLLLIYVSIYRNNNFYHHSISFIIGNSTGGIVLWRHSSTDTPTDISKSYLLHSFNNKEKSKGWHVF